MYNPQDVATKIKFVAKSKEIKINQLLEDIDLNYNTMSNMRTSMPRADNLAKIADYLNCSVDYLLGRTDNPEKQSTTNNISGSITGNAVVGSTHSSVIIDTKQRQESELSKQATELVKIFENLDARSQMKLFSTALELESQNLKK